MKFNKLLILIAVLVCCMFIVMANTDPPEVTETHQYSDLFDYGYSYGELEQPQEYAQRSMYFDEQHG